MKFELQWEPVHKKGTVKPEYPFCALRINPESNEDAAKLEQIIDRGLDLMRIVHNDYIEYLVEIKPLSKPKARMFDKKPTNVHTVKPVIGTLFHGINCLENLDDGSIGFFKSESDRRPSSCTWIDKETAEKLREVFYDKGMILW